jgi:hypothetical protein
MADDNQGCISEINALLLNDNRFEKIEVDHNNYKIEKNASH